MNEEKMKITSCKLAMEAQFRQKSARQGTGWFENQLSDCVTLCKSDSSFGLSFLICITAYTVGWYNIHESILNMTWDYTNVQQSMFNWNKNLPLTPKV